MIYERDSSGKPYIYLSPFASSGDFRFRGTGITGTATKTTTTNIDYKLTEERYINGVQLLCKDAEFGDTVKFQVIDIDNTLGYGANTVLDEFGTNWNIDSSKVDQGEVMLPYPAKIIANLYLRFVYTSVGTTNDVKLAANIFLHKKTVV